MRDRGGRGGWRFGMVEMRVQGRERGMEVWYGRDEGTGEGEEVWYGRDEGTGEGEGDGGLVW